MNTILELFKNQTRLMLKGFEGTLEFIPESLYPKTVCGYPVWHNAYHLVFSTDQFFFDPTNFRPPSLHVPGLNDLGLAPSTELSKKEILVYFHDLKKRIETYLSSLDEEKIRQTISRSRWTRFDLMIGQHRHVYFHLGWLQACLKQEGLALPAWVGIDRDWEEKKV